MEKVKPTFQKYIFICENKRADGVCCSLQGEKIREILKAAVKSSQLSNKIRVSRSGCLDACVDGPNVLLMPDNIWFKRVTERDIDSILDESKKNLSDN